jgi:hypothetical protein
MRLARVLDRAKDKAPEGKVVARCTMPQHGEGDPTYATWTLEFGEEDRQQGGCMVRCITSGKNGITSGKMVSKWFYVVANLML